MHGISLGDVPDFIFASLVLAAAVGLVSILIWFAVGEVGKDCIAILVFLATVYTYVAVEIIKTKQEFVQCCQEWGAILDIAASILGFTLGLILLRRERNSGTIFGAVCSVAIMILKFVTWRYYVHIGKTCPFQISAITTMFVSLGSYSPMLWDMTGALRQQLGQMMIGPQFDQEENAHENAENIADVEENADDSVPDVEENHGPQLDDTQQGHILDVIIVDEEGNTNTNTNTITNEAVEDTHEVMDVPDHHAMWPWIERLLTVLELVMQVWNNRPHILGGGGGMY